MLKKIAIRCAATILVFFIEIYRKFRPVPPRIYFCYNQAIHHIYHSLFIAVELSNIQKKYPVVVFSTSKEASGIIEEELSLTPNNVKFIKIKHPGYNRVGLNVNWFVLLCRLRMHKPKAVIVTDYFDNVFRQLSLKTFWVYTFHGPENRGYTHLHIKDYDLIILPGEGELGRLENKVGKLTNFEITGYSKFDYFRYHKLKPLNLFKDSKPVIMYNPHFDKAQSSFFDKGLELLQALSETNRYNILFMPHPDLARKYPDLVGKSPGIPNVVTVNRPKINLNYMVNVDVYITDVSSAVYEWFYFNKPAVFFNTKGVHWKKNNLYPVWTCGRVVEDIPEMLKAIEDSLVHPEEFEVQRKETFNKTFSSRNKNVSEVIAQVILEKIEKAYYRPQFFFPWDISQAHGLNRLVLPLAKKLSKQSRIRLVCKTAKKEDFPELNFSEDLTRINIITFKRFLSLTPLRWSLKQVTLLEYSFFDYIASRHVEPTAPVYALQGMALCIFKKAEKLGLEKVLIAATLHIGLIWQLHKEEEKTLGYDYEWLNARLKNRILKEYELADVIITPSRLTYQTFLEKGVDEAKLKYQPPETDINYYRRRQAKLDDVFRVLYVGRIAPQKGIHYLIKAYRELNLPNSELLLFGGTATRETRTWLKRLRKGCDNIKVERGDPRPAYEQSSVLVHPSLNDNTGATIYEALAYGLPVIVTENTGAKEAVKDGENGFIIPIRDVEAIKEKILYYYHRK